MINLFQIAPADQSVVYLGQIFGYVGTLLPADNPQVLVGIMFKILNSMALTVGAFLVVYVTSVGLLKTAQEGEFLGKQWNSLWVPLRTVGGTAALFPTSTGYSAIQVVIMWIILQGVGAADTLWTKVVEYLNLTGSPYASLQGVNGVASLGVQNKMKLLFQDLVCQANAKASYPTVPLAKASGTTSEIRYYCSMANDAWCTKTDADMLNIANVDTYVMGPDGKCGQLNLCNQTAACTKTAQNPAADVSPACISCKAQRQTMQSIIPVLGAVAKQFVDVDHQYAQFHESEKSTKPDAQPIVTPDWVKTYCSDKGIAPEKCCVYPTSSCAGIFPSAVVSNDDMGNTSYSSATPIIPTRSATDLYLQYPLNTYISGNDFINAAVGEYLAAIVGGMSAQIQQTMGQMPYMGKMFQAAKSYGWIFAGNFYYQIAAENRTALSAVVTPLDVTKPKDVNNPLGSHYRNNFNASSSLQSAMVSTTNAQNPKFTASKSSDVSPEVSDAMNDTNAAIFSSWVSNLSGEGSTAGFSSHATNPLIAIASFGYELMIIAQITFAVIVTVVSVATAVATLNPMSMGTGVTMSPIGEGVKAVANLLGPFFIILIGSLFSIGAVLGIYVPLIPFMVFGLGAIGWLIATIEAMVAAPIIALGILSPGGQHDILGRAEPALMQLFNLFLRPSLMVLGMMMSMFLAIVVLKLINQGFLSASGVVLRTQGLFEQIMFIAVYTSFVVTAMTKVFSLIYVIPERILTYIGGPAVSYGEEKDLAAQKQAVEGAAGATTGAAKEAGGSVSAGVQAVKHAIAGEKEDSQKGAGKAFLQGKKPPEPPAG